jgi:glycosyltransferase involved in cell wall biosynthesis
MSKMINIIQINATDSIIGGASRIAQDLHSYFKIFPNDYVSKMFVGLKFTSDKDIMEIKNSIFSKIFSRIFADDTRFFSSDSILQTKEYNDGDIINMHNIHGWYFNLDTLKKIARDKKVVWTLHDMWAITPHCAHSYNSPLNNGFYECRSNNDYPQTLWDNNNQLKIRKRQIYKDLDIDIVVPSKWLLEKVKSSVLKDKRIHLIYNGIDTNVFKRIDKIDAREKLGLPRDQKIALFIANKGCSNNFKGGHFFMNLIKDFRSNVEVLFLIIGEEVEYQDNNVIYRKNVSQKEVVATYMSACDFLIFPSLAENFPLVILEAMSCGLPVISFDVGGVKEVVEHMENGYIARYGDYEDLKRGFIMMLGFSKEMIQRIEERSVIKIRENFSLEKMVGDYMNLYKKIIYKKY